LSRARPGRGPGPRGAQGHPAAGNQKATARPGRTVGCSSRIGRALFILSRQTGRVPRGTGPCRAVRKHGRLMHGSPAAPARAARLRRRCPRRRSFREPGRATGRGRIGAAVRASSIPPPALAPARGEPLCAPAARRAAARSTALYMVTRRPEAGNHPAGAGRAAARRRAAGHDGLDSATPPRA